MNRKEFIQLYTQEQPRVVNIIKAILGQTYEREAEDCAQDVFVSVLKKVDTESHIEDPIDYLFVCATHRACKLKKKLSKTDTYAELPDYIAGACDE